MSVATVTLVGQAIAERIQRQVESGRYADASEVVSQALDVLENAQKLRVLRELVAEAMDDLANGDVYEMTPTFWDEIWAEADEEDRLGVPIPDHV